MDNVQHFLRYSLDKERRIVLMYLNSSGKAEKKIVRVLAVSEETVEVSTGRKTYTLSREDVLGAGYARGDTGDLERIDE